MALLASMIYYFGVCFAALAGLAFLSRRLYQKERELDALHYVTTKDGWRLALGHYCAKTTRPDALPVLLCTGLGLNTSLFERGEVSLIEFLREAGYDVWTLDLRGRGGSSRPRLWGSYSSKWRFDDYVEFDIPAAVAEVCRHTGRSQLHWIGLGLGASAAFCSLGSERGIGGSVRSCISLGGPAFFGRQAREVSPRLMSLLRFVPVRAAIELLVPVIGRPGWWPMSLLCNADNVDGVTLRRALINAIESISTRELQQLVSWIEHDGFLSMDGTADYRSRLAAVYTPTLMVLAPRDRLAPPTMIQETYEALGADDKALLFAGREGGMNTNYGHLDLVLGRMAGRDLFPRITTWLDAHHVERTIAEQPGPSFASDIAEEEASSESESTDDTDPLEMIVGDVPVLPDQPTRHPQPESTPPAGSAVSTPTSSASE